ncbi:MAG: PilZ domain-containing protein [Desulfobulbaceae bacterium]|nr:PilZ domain-containing protein [Desulfobulbaceae bacterium]
MSNISLSGCFFPSDSELPVGEQCDVTITTGEGLETEKVTVRGMIVRNDSEGAGISFTDDSLESRRRLDKIISRQTAK